jgi:hypothetical protein
MDVEPVGLPAALKAWRDREPEPVLTMRCTVDGCGVEVGAVYRSPRAVVVESRLSEPQEKAEEFTPMDLADFADSLGVTGLLEGFGGGDQNLDLGGEGAATRSTVRAQIDLLHSELYWHDPQPVCPSHGELRIDRAQLAEAVREGQDSYEVAPG